MRSDDGEPRVGQLTHELARVAEQLVFRSVVAIEEPARDFAHRLSRGKSFPHRGTDLVEPEVNPSFEVEHDDLVVEAPRVHVGAERNPRIRRELVAIHSAPLRKRPCTSFTISSASKCSLSITRGRRS